ncbi:radical SAM protein [bacterium]|nr:radical SAM protein [bacterium]
MNWFRGNIKPGPPFFINIEPTNICNLKCTICSLDKIRKPEYMDFDLFKEIVDKAANFGIVEVRLFLAGEPLLHKKLPEMIRYAKTKELLTTIHTNATKLTEDLGRSLIESGLDILSISFHGEDKEEYENIMVGAKFDRVHENVISFLNLKKEINSIRSVSKIRLKCKPEVFIQVVKATPQHSLTLSKNFEKRFEGLPVNRFIVLSPHNWAGEIKHQWNAARRNYYYRCQFLYQSMSVAVNGDVFSCCGDLNGRMIIDNVKNKTLKEIWHSDKFCEMRKNLKNGNFKCYSSCSFCDAIWRRRHPLIGEVASIIKLPYLKRKLETHFKKKG